MSLTQALNNPGDTRYTILAIVREVRETEYSQKSGKAFQKTQLDDGQMQHSVKIHQGNNPPLTQQHIGQRLSFSINGYTSTFDDQTYLSGFWNSKAQTASPQSPQGRQQLSQGKKSAQGMVDDGVEIRKTAYIGACTLISKAEKCTDIEVLKFAQKAEKYIATGEIEQGYNTQIEDLGPAPNDVPEPDKSITEVSSGHGAHFTDESKDDMPF